MTQLILILFVTVIKHHLTLHNAYLKKDAAAKFKLQSGVTASHEPLRHVFYRLI